jgi:hypothetical protein
MHEQKKLLNILAEKEKKKQVENAFRKTLVYQLHVQVLTNTCEIITT